MPNSIDYDESFIYDQKNDREEEVEPELREYDVFWSIVVTAENEEDAVRIAHSMIADPDTIATYFRVVNTETGESTMKDYEDVLFPERSKAGDNIHW
jgi:hypothetical protein